MNREELEIQQLILSIEREKQQIAQEKDIWQQDKDASIREIARRNIETCISVVKCCVSAGDSELSRLAKEEAFSCIRNQMNLIPQK